MSVRLTTNVSCTESVRLTSSRIKLRIVNLHFLFLFYCLTFLSMADWSDQGIQPHLFLHALMKLLLLHFSCCSIWHCLALSGNPRNPSEPDIFFNWESLYMPGRASEYLTKLFKWIEMELLGIFSLSIIMPIGFSSALPNLGVLSSSSEDSGSIAKRSFFSSWMLFSTSIE